MESNRDEALKCLSISQRYRDAGNLTSARKFCVKSITLFATPEATKLLKSIDDMVNGEATSASKEAGSSSSGTYTSSTEAHPSSSGARHRHGNTSEASAKATPNGTASGSGGEKRDYTPDQAAIVKRIRSCKVTEYYEILSVKRECEEVEIKKAYRKLALQLHPDKNGAPGAVEAFKMVSKAFQILSDPQKRAAFDQHGSDPDSRSSGMSPSAANMNGFASGPFDGELSPEDLFNMFFGGGGMGGPFGSGLGGGPVFSASFGPGGGIRTHRVYTFGRGPTAEQDGTAAARDTSIRAILTQLAPLLILFLFTIMSALPSMFSPSAARTPHYSFSPSQRYTAERHTGARHVRYHVDPAEFNTHPVGVEAIRAESTKTTSYLLQKFERTIESTYINQMYGLCQRQLEDRQRRKEQHMGIFGIGADWEAVKRIEAERFESCEEYNRLVQ